jgi:hypothetical protein
MYRISDVSELDWQSPSSKAVLAPSEEMCVANGNILLGDVMYGSFHDKLI